MLCIGAVGTEQSCSLEESYGTQLVALPSLSSASTLKSSSSTATTVTVQPGSEFDSGVDVSYRANAAAGGAGGAGTSSSYSGFFEGIFGCLRPVWSVLGKATSAESKQKGTACQLTHLRCCKTNFAQFVIFSMHLSSYCTLLLDHFCLSICSSVCPSCFGIVSRRMKIRLCGFQHLVGESSSF